MPGQHAPAGRYSVADYLALLDDGTLCVTDRVELLGGLVVAEPPATPGYASVASRVASALQTAVGNQGVVRVQLPFDAGGDSLPEPTVAVVPGQLDDYDTDHPTRALLVVEVASATALQHRLTKAPIYAAAAVPEYWIVNLVDGCVETYRTPAPAKRRYTLIGTAGRGETLVALTLHNVSIAVNDLLPTT